MSTDRNPFSHLREINEGVCLNTCPACVWERNSSLLRIFRQRRLRYQPDPEGDRPENQGSRESG